MDIQDDGCLKEFHEDYWGPDFNSNYDENWLTINEAYLESIFFDSFNLTLDEMLSYFALEKVAITDEDIVDFLDKKAYEVGIDRSLLLEDRPTEAKCKKSLLQTMYTYNGYDRQYFEEVINTLCYHGSKLCRACKDISNKKYNSLILEKLNIKIRNKRVKKIDIDRLLDVIGYIYFEVRSLTIRANNLDTYTGTVINWKDVANKQLLEEDLYPTSDTVEYFNNPSYTKKRTIR